MSVSYASVERNIQLILEKRYKLTSDQAKQAIETSPLRSIFDRNTDMAAHTSNETWARRVFDYYKENGKKR